MVFLFGHQRVSVDRMADLESRQEWTTADGGFTMPTQTGVLANAIGSGKTFTALWFLHERAQAAAAAPGATDLDAGVPDRLWCRVDPGTDGLWGGAWLHPTRAGVPPEVQTAQRAQGWPFVNVVVCTRALVAHWEAEWGKDAALQRTVPLYAADEPGDVAGAMAWARTFAAGPRGVEPLLVVSDGLVESWLQAVGFSTACLRRLILDDIHVCALPRVTTRPWVLLARFVWVLSSTPTDVIKWAGRRHVSFPQLGVVADPATWIQVPLDTRMAVTDVEPDLVHRVRRGGGGGGGGDTALDHWGLAPAQRRGVLQAWDGTGGGGLDAIVAVLVETKALYPRPVEVTTWLQRWWAWRTDAEREAEALAPRRTAAQWRRRRQVSEAVQAAWPARWAALQEGAQAGYARTCPICHEEPGTLAGPSTAHSPAAALPPKADPASPPPWHAGLAHWTVWSACCVQQFCAPCWWSYYQHQHRAAAAAAEAPLPRRRRRREEDDLLHPLDGAVAPPAQRPRTRAAVAEAARVVPVAAGPAPVPAAPVPSWEEVAYRAACPFCRTLLACPLGDLAWAPAVSTAGELPAPVFMARAPLDVAELPRALDIFTSLLHAGPHIRLLIATDQHGTWEAFADMWARAGPSEAVVDLSGTAKQIQRKLEHFRSGRARALFLNADVHSAGVHLPEATDVCLLHNFDPDTTRQIIGRAARFPRPAQQALRVHRFEFV